MKKLLYLFAILVIGLISTTLKAQSGWTLQSNPLGSGNSAEVGKIQFVSANEGWISAGNGKLLHTTNGGINWLIVNPEPIDTLFSWIDPAVSMSFINPSTGWIIRTKGSFSNWQGAVVYKTTNGGANWNKVSIPNYDAGIYIQFVDENNGWIIVFNTNFTGGGIFRTTNGGTDWNAIPQPGGLPFFINSNSGWLTHRSSGSGTSSDSIWKTTNGGLTWTRPWGTNAQVSFNAMHFSDVNNGWAVGRNGLILKTTNGGNSWTYVTNSGITSNFNSKTVFFLNANTGWIGTKEDGTNNIFVLYTNNGGITWTWQWAPLQNSIFSIHFFDALNGGLTGDYGAICRTTTGGTTGVEENNNSILSEFSLSQNYPNPFNPSTTIKFSLPSMAFVSLKVFDVLGREVETLITEELNVGEYSTQWNAEGFSSGVYFYRLEIGSFVETKKLVLLK